MIDGDHGVDQVGKSRKNSVLPLGLVRVTVVVDMLLFLVDMAAVLEVAQMAGSMAENMSVGVSRFGEEIDLRIHEALTTAVTVMLEHHMADCVSYQSCSSSKRVEPNCSTI
jgi:cytochrome b